MVQLVPHDLAEGCWLPNGSAEPQPATGRSWRSAMSNQPAIAGDESRRPPGALALARALASCPPDPRSLLATIERELYFRVEVPAQFVEIVETVFAEDDAVRRTILDAGGAGDWDEGARVETFLAEVNRRLFPVEECCEEYATLIRAIPFQPMGYDEEALEGLYDRPGFQALIALVAPDAPAAAARSQLLHERCDVPLATLAFLPREPPSLAELRRRFDGGPRAAVADMARWLRAETGTVFLDSTYESAESYWLAWTEFYVAALAEQWTVARALMDRVGALAEWLEGDLPRRFRELLLIIGRRDANGRSRRASRRRSRKRGQIHRAP